MKSIKRHSIFRGVMVPTMVFLLGLAGCGKPELKEVRVSPAEKEIMVGESIEFEVEGLSGKGERMAEVAFQWSLEGDAGAIDNSGRFEARKPGKVQVIATAAGVSGKAQIVVLARPIRKIEVEAEKSHALPGTTVPIRIRGFSESDMPASYGDLKVSALTVSTSLPNKLLTLDERGKAGVEVTLSPEPGENVILFEGDEVEKEVKLEATSITRLEIKQKNNVFEAGETIDFATVGFDDYGNQRKVEVEWNLIEEIAQSQEGNQIIMLKPGKGILFAQYKEIRQGFPFSVVPGRVARITLSPSSAQLKAGERTKFSAQAFNAQDYPVSAQVRWEIEGEIGSISEDGAFTARKAGKGAVRAGAAGVFAKAAVEVQHGPLSDITIVTAGGKLPAGRTIELVARGVDAYGNHFVVRPEWFLSKSLGTIDTEKHTFSPVNVGTGEIKAMVGNILRGVQIEVVPAELAQVEFAPKKVDLIAGEKVQFEVKGLDRFGNRVDVQPDFSVQEPLGELSSTGFFKARKAGSTVVKAAVGEFVAQGTLAVRPAEMEELIVEPAGPVEMTAGKALEFSVFGVDRFENTVNSAVDWQVEPELGRMNERHVFAPLKVGKGRLNVTLKQLRTEKIIQESIPISIRPGETARIEISPSSRQTTSGDTSEFSAVAYDTVGNETGVPVTWSVEDSALGKIGATGVFRALKAGEGKILARHENVVAEAKLKVLPGPIAFLKITPEKITLDAGEVHELKAIAEDKFGNGLQADIIWSLSNASLGNIKENRLTAAKMGRGQLIAAAGAFVDMVPLDIRKGPLASIELTAPEKVAPAGEKAVFDARGFDAGGNPVMVQPRWLVEDEGLGRINQKGVFSAQKAGKGFVKALSGDVGATGQVEVVPGAPAEVRLQPAEINTIAGESTQLAFEVFDAYENMVPQPELTWEVSQGVGRVTAEHEFEAQKSGQGRIRCIAGEAAAEIAVKVAPGKIHLIKMHPEELEMTAGEEVEFKAGGYDAQGNSVELKPSWSVGGGIGVVDDSGVFQAVTAGKGQVAVQMEDVVGVAGVTVLPGPAASVVVEPAESTLRAGESLDFKATALDAFGNVTPAEFAWQLEAKGEFGELDQTGGFKALLTGNAKIAARTQGVIGKATVKVLPAGLQRIFLSKENIDLRSGEKLKLQAVGEDVYGNVFPVQPQFSIESDELGTIDSEGVFEAVKTGAGRLTAELEGLATSVPVKIAAGKLRKLVIELPAAGVMAGKSYTFGIKGYDGARNEVAVDAGWAVTEAIGRINNDTGEFYAVRAGKGLLVAHSRGVVARAVLEVKPGELNSLFIEPNPVTVKSGTVQFFTVKGFDVEHNEIPVPAAGVSWKELGGNGFFKDNGVFQGTEMGKGKVIAEAGNLIAEAYVTVVPGAPDPAHCRTRVTYPTLPAGGEAFTEVILEVRDGYNNPVPGVKVILVSNRQDDSIVQPAKTDGRGLSRGRISSEQAGSAIISAVVADKAILDTAEIHFE